MVGQIVKNRFAALFVAVAGHKPALLEQAPQARFLLFGQGAVINDNNVIIGNSHGGRVQAFAIQLYFAIQNKLFGIAARTHTGARNALGNAFTRQVFCRGGFGGVFAGILDEIVLRHFRIKFVFSMRVFL